MNTIHHKKIISTHESFPHSPITLTNNKAQALFAHTFFGQAYRVYSGIEFEMDMNKFKRPPGHGIRWDETDNGVISLPDETGELQTYKFFNDDFDQSGNGMIWNVTRDGNDDPGFSYRVNTAKGYSILDVVNEYLSHPEKYAIDCGSFASLSYLSTLLTLFNGFLDIDKLSRQNAMISAAINYTVNDRASNINQYLFFTEVGRSQKDLDRIQPGDLIFLGDREEGTLNPQAAHVVTIAHIDKTSGMIFAFNPAYDVAEPFLNNDKYYVNRILRLDVPAFLEKFGTDSVGNILTAVKDKSNSDLATNLLNAIIRNDIEACRDLIPKAMASLPEAALVGLFRQLMRFDRQEIVELFMQTDMIGILNRAHVNFSVNYVHSPTGQMIHQIAMYD